MSKRSRKKEINKMKALFCKAVELEQKATGLHQIQLCFLADMLRSEIEKEEKKLKR